MKKSHVYFSFFSLFLILSWGCEQEKYILDIPFVHSESQHIIIDSNKVVDTIHMTTHFNWRSGAEIRYRKNELFDCDIMGVDVIVNGLDCAQPELQNITSNLKVEIKQEFKNYFFYKRDVEVSNLKKNCQDSVITTNVTALGFLPVIELFLINKNIEVNYQVIIENPNQAYAEFDLTLNMNFIFKSHVNPAR